MPPAREPADLHARPPALPARPHTLPTVARSIRTQIATYWGGDANGGRTQVAAIARSFFDDTKGAALARALASAPPGARPSAGPGPASPSGSASSAAASPTSPLLLTRPLESRGGPLPSPGAGHSAAAAASAALSSDDDRSSSGGGLSQDLTARYLSLAALAAIIKYVEHLQRLSFASGSLRLVWREAAGRMVRESPTARAYACARQQYEMSALISFYARAHAAAALRTRSPTSLPHRASLLAVAGLRDRP